MSKKNHIIARGIPTERRKRRRINTHMLKETNDQLNEKAKKKMFRKTITTRQATIQKRRLITLTTTQQRDNVLSYSTIQTPNPAHTKYLFGHIEESQSCLYCYYYYFPQQFFFFVCS